MSNLFNIGDEQRLEREEGLTGQLPRQLMRTPDESIMNTERQAEDFSQAQSNDAVFDGMLAALQRRLS